MSSTTTSLPLSLGDTIELKVGGLCIRSKVDAVEGVGAEEAADTFHRRSAPTTSQISDGNGTDGQYTLQNTTVAFLEPSDVTVAVVDDERVNLLIVSRLLTQVGYRVKQFGSGIECLNALIKEPKLVDLVLTDVVMPEMTGKELLEEMKNVASLKNLPTVMMSAVEEADTVLMCLNAGADDYLLKPVSARDLQHLWRHVWKRRVKMDARSRRQPQPAAEPQEAPEEDMDDADSAENFDMMTAEEVEIHCNNQIEYYERIRSLVRSHPEYFPGAADDQEGGDAA